MKLFLISVTEIFLISLVWSAPNTICPSVCKCFRNKSQAVCQDKVKLTFIPSFPEWVTSLIFTGNDLPYVSENTFANVTTLRLEDLVLRHNNMTKISSNALRGLSHIRHLDLSGNGNLQIKELEACLSQLKSENFTSISLNSLAWKEEPVTIYQALSLYNITKLTLSKNYLTILNLSAISKSLPYLEMLNVAYNNIETIVPGQFNCLINLQLHHNYIDVDKPYLFMTNETCNFPQLKILDLASNYVNYFYGRFNCLEKLEYLSLDRNPVKQIFGGTFENLTSLHNLHLENMGDRLFRIHGYAFQSNSLRVLKFANNHFSFLSTSTHTYFDADDIFAGMPNLEELDLSMNYFNITDGILKRMLSKVNQLRKLTIKYCSIGTIPPDIFFNMYRLEMLNLSRNHISHWKGTKVFGNLSSLQVLRLDHNYINVFNETSFPEQLITNLKVINMKSNPFYCGCKNLWFRKWIEERTNIFSEYPEGYFCHNPPELAGTLLKDYFPSDRECNPTNTFLHVVTTLSLIGIFSVIVISLVYKGRWHIRYWIYLHRSNRRILDLSVESCDSFLYSGFVVYCDQDREWVLTTFLNVVEKESGLKLCIHDRDFVIGKLIVDNIAENIASSRKVILIMSSSMIQSDWCIFETRLAQRKFLNDEDGSSLFTIMLDNIQKKDMPLSLRNLVDMTTYISWSEDPYIQDRFWKTVIRALRE